MRQYVLHFLVLAALLTVWSGCSSDSRLAISGVVSLDGKPLDGGAISFRPAPGNDGNSAGGTIANGRFHFPANSGLKPGKYSVVVQIFHLTGRMILDPDTGEKTPEIKQVIFKDAGRLEAEVSAENANDFQFHLTRVHAP